MAIMHVPSVAKEGFAGLMGVLIAQDAASTEKNPLSIEGEDDST